jgi:hypothetical protein
MREMLERRGGTVRDAIRGKAIRHSSGETVRGARRVGTRPLRVRGPLCTATHPYDPHVCACVMSG